MSNVGSDGQTMGDTIWQQSNAHASGVKSTAIVEGGKHLLTCSNTEAALWSSKHD